MKPNDSYQITQQQVEQRPLGETCLLIAEAVLKGHKPDGALFAYLAKQLIAAEVCPGGPYYSADKSIDFFTNLAIGYLFVCLKKPLLNVDKFIADIRKKTPHEPHVKALLADYDHLRISPKSKVSLEKSHSSIYTQVEESFFSLEEPLKTHAATFLARLEKADKTQEIALLPSIFYHSLVSPFSFPPLNSLGMANIYSWMAYTIYDHILDSEPAIDYLPVANVAMRQALASYQNVFPASHSFQQKVADTFTDMDAANSWELNNARFEKKKDKLVINTIPSYGRCEILAKRSFAHALGPLAIASLATSNSDALEYIEKGLRHYLIARQLNDDLHDWQQDIRNGHATIVVSHILKHAKVKPGTYDIEPLIKRMQSNFWSHSLQVLTTSIHRHSNLSRKNFTKSSLIKEGGEMAGLLDRLEAIATASRAEYERYKNFATAYRKLSQNETLTKG